MQELAFLDHLLRLVDGDGPGYDATASTPGRRPRGWRPATACWTSRSKDASDDDPSLTGFEISLSGLEADQAAIDTTGHNIANENTPGFSRQRVNMTAATSLILPSASSQTGSGVQLGEGVDLTQINRVRNQFLDIQYRAQNTATRRERPDPRSARRRRRSPSRADGLSAQLATFYSDWNAVANAPTDAGARQTLVDDATTLTQSFNSLSGQLASVQSQASQQYAALTGAGGQLQSDANQIAKLNGAISQALGAGQQPNDLEDQRDSLLDDLSSLGQVSVTDPGNGLLKVSFGDAATPLVSGTTVTWPQTLTSATGGQLGALLSLASPTGAVGQLGTSLNGVASQLISSVNALHTSTPFFSGTSASTIAVAVTAAQVQTSASAAPGGRRRARIAGLAGGADDQAYAALVSQVGTSVAGREQSAVDRAGARHRRRQPAPERVGRVARSGDGQPDDLPQRLPGVGARNVRYGRVLQTLINNTGTVGL